MIGQKVESETNRKQNQSPSRQKSGMHVHTPHRPGDFSICDQHTGRVIQKLLKGHSQDAETMKKSCGKISLFTH